MNSDNSGREERLRRAAYFSEGSNEEHLDVLTSGMAERGLDDQQTGLKGATKRRHRGATRSGGREEHLPLFMVWRNEEKSRKPFSLFLSMKERREEKHNYSGEFSFLFVFQFFNFLMTCHIIIDCVQKWCVGSKCISQEHVMYLPSGPFSKKNIGFTQTGWTMRTAGLYQFKTGFSRFPIGLIAECFQVVLDRI